MTVEELGRAHQVADIWHWGRPGEQKVRWQCSCGWRSKHPTAVGRNMSLHQSLRFSHFQHLKAMKRAAGLV